MLRGCCERVAPALLWSTCWLAIGVDAIRCPESDGGGPCSLSDNTGCGPLCEAAVNVGIRAHRSVWEQVNDVATRIIASGRHYAEKLGSWSMGTTSPKGDLWARPAGQHIASWTPGSSQWTSSFLEKKIFEMHGGSDARSLVFGGGTLCPQTHVVASNRTIGTSVRIGCKHGCSCPSFERCYMRYSEGICDMEVYVMVFMSVAIVAIILCSLFLMRVYLLYWEFVAEQMRDRRPETAVSREVTPVKAAKSNGGEIVIFDEDDFDQAAQTASNVADGGASDSPRCGSARAWSPWDGEPTFLGGPLDTIPSDRESESPRRRSMDTSQSLGSLFQTSSYTGGNGSGGIADETRHGRASHASRRRVPGAESDDADLH